MINIALVKFFEKFNFVVTMALTRHYINRL